MTKLKGLILAGGLSSRMGQDKAFLKIKDSIQLEYLIKLYETCNLIPAISCREEQLESMKQYAGCITDRYNQIGPLGGVLSAFEKEPETAWLLTACDMPNIKKEDIDRLIEERDPLAKLSCYMTTDGFPEPLFSIWEPGSYEDLIEAYKNNNYSLVRLINKIEAKKIPARSDEIFVNINTPEELNKYS